MSYIQQDKYINILINISIYVDLILYLRRLFKYED